MPAASQGQVVIPTRLRDHQGLGPGSAVTFEERPDGVLLKAERAPDSLRGRYRRSGLAARGPRRRAKVRSCLDAWAVLAWLDGDEPAAEIVQGELYRERPVMCWINLVEVEYRLSRHHGAGEAGTVLARLRELVTEELPGVTRMRDVAALKADHPIALAGCFAIATAQPATRP